MLLAPSHSGPTPTIIPSGFQGRVSDVEGLQQEAYLAAAGKVILVRASLDEFRDVLVEGDAVKARREARR